MLQVPAVVPLATCTHDDDSLSPCSGADLHVHNAQTMDIALSVLVKKGNERGHCSATR